MGSIALSQWIRDWCLEIEMATGVKPLIYSTRWYANNHFRLDLIQYGFWVATYPADPSSNPSSITPWITWTFQQYRTDPTTQKTDPDLTTEPLVAGTCPGIQGYVDLDSFNGDLAGLKALAGLP
jgi:GH25 family lysozyme M1 (1,4-beta-N-acetylmuramidase)